MGGDDGGGSPHRTGRVHPQDWLAHGTERRREVQLGHHDALEHVRGLADDHGLDVGPVHPGILKGAHRRLAHEPGDGHVVALGLALGLPEPNHGTALGTHHASLPPTGPDGVAARAHTRFCCRHGPEVAWATAVSAVPSMIRCAASPMRTSPATISALAASAPPEGLTTVVSG